jgi:hypothetical protein
LRVKLICKRKVKTFKSNLASKTWRKKTLIVIKVKLTGKKFGLELHFGDLVEVCGEVPHVVHAIARQRLGGRHHGQSGHILQQIFSSLNKENKD